MKLLTCTEVETAYLSERDHQLGDAIQRIGKIERICYPDFFEGFANAIIGQQISTKAMETIWGKIIELCEKITPECIMSMNLEDLKRCGISERKTGYLKNCAQLIMNGSLCPNEFEHMSDDEVCHVLTGLKGVGTWTAEMLLIFTLGRKDVLSFGDYGIRKGISILHELDELDMNMFEKFQECYSPYGTVASLYLWEIARGS